MRIFSKLLLSMTAFTGLSLGALTLVVLLQGRYEFAELSKDYGQSLATQVAHFAAEPVLASDLLSLKVLINSLDETTHVQYAAILDEADKPLVTAGTRAPNASLYRAPIRFQGSRAGSAIVGLDPKQLTKAVTHSLAMLAALAVVLLGFGAFGIFGLVKHITDGLAATANGLKRLSKGDIGTLLSAQRKDEVGMLMQSFNQLSQELFDRDQLQQPRAVHPMASRRQHQLGDGYIHITQLFITLTDVNRQIDKLAIENFQELIDAYTQVISLAAHQFNCDSCQFERQGLAIRFISTDLSSAQQGCLDGVCAGFLALRLIDRLNQHRLRCHLPTIRASAGLHHGTGFTTKVQTKDSNRAIFMTDVDNDAVMLAKIAQSGRVVISQAAIRQVASAQMIHFTEHRVYPMTDFSGELHYSSIAGLAPQLRKPLQQQADELFQALYPNHSENKQGQAPLHP